MTATESIATPSSGTSNVAALRPISMTTGPPQSYAASARSSSTTSVIADRW
jgi:hypothetical protein